MKRVALTALLVAGFTVVPAVPAQAAACAGTTGVTVVVDFGPLGGGVQTRCAPGDPATGVEALKQAGFTVAGTQRWGPAFVCRIDNKPGADTESCVDTPPAAAHWGYSYASRGGHWTMSEKGPMARKPPQGSVEGWAFGAGITPSVAPPAAPVPPAPAPATTTARPGQTTPGVDPAVPESSTVDNSPTPAESSAGASVSASGSAGPVGEAAIALQRSNFTGTAVTIGLVLALGTAAAVIARRRRRSGSES